MNSRPEEPSDRGPWTSNVDQGTELPRVSSKTRTIHLWSPDSEYLQEQPHEHVEKIENVLLNTNPVKDQPRKRDIDDGARNNKVPSQNFGKEIENISRDIPPEKATHSKEHPRRVRSNVFAIVGRSGQIQSIHAHADGPRDGGKSKDMRSKRPFEDELLQKAQGHRQDVEVADKSRQMELIQGKEDNRAIRRDEHRGQLPRPKVVDISAEQVVDTGNGEEGHLQDQGKTGQGTRKEMIEPKIPRADENHNLIPKTEEVFLKEQLRDADYRAKLRNELLVTNRKQRESAQYLLSQMRASFSSDEDEGLQEEERQLKGNDEYHDQTDRFVQEKNDFNATDEERHDGQPRNMKGDKLLSLVAGEEMYWKQKHEEEKANAERDFRRQQQVEKFNGYSEPRSHNMKEEEYLGKWKAEEEYMAQEAKKDTKQRERQQQQDEAIESLITPTEKPPQAFSLNEELFDLFREDADEQEEVHGQKSESARHDKYENDARVHRNGPTAGSEIYAYQKGTQINGPKRHDRHELKKYFQVNGYAGYSYPEPEVHSQSNGPEEYEYSKPETRSKGNGSTMYEFSKPETRSQRNGPPGYDYSRPDTHSQRNGPSRFGYSKADTHSKRNGPPGYDNFKPETRSKRNGPQGYDAFKPETHSRRDVHPAYNDPEAEVHSVKNGPAGYNIYKTFVHGKNNHVVCEYCGTTIEKSPSMFVAEVNKYWHVHCFQCVVCQANFNEHSGHMLHITDSRLHCERCFITDEGKGML